MCICVLNGLPSARHDLRAPEVPAVHEGRVRGELRHLPRDPEGVELGGREERERRDDVRRVRPREVEDPPRLGEVLRDHELDHAGVQVGCDAVLVPAPDLVYGRGLGSNESFC